MRDDDDLPDVSPAAVASRLRQHVVELRARLRTPSAAWSRESDRLGLAYALDGSARMAENERSQAEAQERSERSQAEIERAGLARRGERLQ